MFINLLRTVSSAAGASGSLSWRGARLFVSPRVERNVMNHAPTPDGCFYFTTTLRPPTM